MAQTPPNTTLQWEQEWERVLWKKKPYPDNYVPRPRFLEFLKTNGAVGIYRWSGGYLIVCFPYPYRQLRTPSLWPPCYCGIGDSTTYCHNIRIHFRLHTHKRAILGSTHAHLGGCSYLLDWVHFLGGVVATSRATASCVPYISSSLGVKYN